MNARVLIVVALACSWLSARIGTTHSPEISSLLIPFSGVVQSSKRVPLRDVNIELKSLSDGATFVTHTNSAGLFRYALAEGEYQVTATSRTQKSSKLLRIARGKNWFSIVLKEKPLETAAPAMSVYRLAVPEKARSLYKKARKALKVNDRVAAVQHIENAIEFYPPFVEALTIRSTLERDSDPHRALADAEQAIGYDPNYGDAYIALASAYTSIGRFDDAVRMLDRGIPLVPTFWLGYYEMSRVLVCKQDYAAALGYLEISFALAPKSHAFLHITKADILIGLHDNSAAIRELEAYLEKAPDGLQVSQARQNIQFLNAH